jgi:hypothetical protein
MFSSFDLLAFVLILPLFSLALPFAGHNAGLVERVRGFDLPIHRSTGAGGIHKRGGVSGSIALGDNLDLLANTLDR